MQHEDPFLNGLNIPLHMKFRTILEATQETYSTSWLELTQTKEVRGLQTTTVFISFILKTKIVYIEVKKKKT